MHRLFLDTEFTHLGHDRRLISLALVDPAGPHCYVELNEGWTLHDCSAFVVDIVLPQLDPARHGLDRSQAAASVLAFLAHYPCAEIISDALAWDWPLLQWLLAPTPVPGGICAREIRGLLSRLPAGQIPHHALLDAQLMAKQHTRVVTPKRTGQRCG